jgi:tetratricopeptide (TPR) repeat protein
MILRVLVVLGAAALTWACDERDARELPVLPAGAETVTLLGDTVSPPALTLEVRQEREARLAQARRAYEATPEDVDSIIWLGRRLAYLGRYREAIEVYTEGMRLHPTDARLYRHRGHRYITLRELAAAIEDLAHAAKLVAGQADEVEPDGLPNVRGIPTSTLQSNIWYHLGLAHYLRGDFERAATSYRMCLDVSATEDMVVATSHWLYMTLRRLDRLEEAETVLAPIHAGMDIIENTGYHRLLLMYQGELTPEDLLEDAASDDDALANATVGYGVGNWHLYNGRDVEAETVFRRILEGEQWAAFGFIAAEAESARVSR